MEDGLMDLVGAKEIPILIEGGHRVIAVQVPTHSLSDDVETVKRAVELVG